jgi:formylmethanofuran dehydrogenase subunit E
MHASIVKEKNYDIQICQYSLHDFLSVIKKFHGSVSPGILMGGFMVDYALKNLPDGEFFDAISETRACLPDAIQLLTPCTIGNGWMKIMNFSRYALSLYEKKKGDGVRIYFDPGKVSSWPEIQTWFYKLKPKKEQNSDRLIQEIIDAGHDLYGLRRIKIRPDLLAPGTHSDRIIHCSKCGEPIRSVLGTACPACMGEDPYVQP